MKTKELKETKGITLIALIITIIVLLLLAGISIQMITGENGLLIKVATAKQANEEATELELIKLAVTAAQTAGEGKLTEENLNNELKANFDDDNATAEKIGSNYYYKEYCIEENGNVEKYDKLLPKEYQQVEYIESTGTQWIDIGIKLNQDTTAILDIQITAPGNYHIFGSRTSPTSNSFHICFSPENNYYRADFQDWTVNNLNIMPHYNRNTIKISKNELSIGEISKKVNNYSNFETPSNALVFYTEGNTAMGYAPAKMKLYLCEILDRENLRKKMIPCYSTTAVTDVNGKQCPQDTIGLYDLVEDKFYTNQGSGTFLKGNDVYN